MDESTYKHMGKLLGVRFTSRGVKLSHDEVDHETIHVQVYPASHEAVALWEFSLDSDEDAFGKLEIQLEDALTNSDDPYEKELEAEFNFRRGGWELDEDWTRRSDDFFDTLHEEIIQSMEEYMKYRERYIVGVDGGLGRKFF